MYNPIGKIASRDLKIIHPCAWAVNSSRSCNGRSSSAFTLIGRCRFILQYHDSPEKDVTGPETKRSLVGGIKIYISQLYN